MKEILDKYSYCDTFCLTGRMNGYTVSEKEFYDALAYKKESDRMYLRLTEKGEVEVFNFERKHKNAYTKKEPNRKHQIVEIK